MERFTLENIEVREPVLDDQLPERFDFARIDEQWGLLTEAVRQEMLADPTVRDFVAQQTTTPVSESLPNNFLLGLSADARVARLEQRYAQEIGAFLALPAIPDEILTPDVSHAPRLESPAFVLRNFDPESEAFQKQAQHFIDGGRFAKGITGDERKMVAKRYRFARDIKLLALGAEIAQQPQPLLRDEKGEIVLPSQTTIDISQEDAASRPELLNPQQWIKRKQLKDRVHVVEAESSRYILKEKKTARHTDTKQGGHQQGLSSAAEVRTARHFQEHGRIEQGDLAVNWEKPVAAVTFPDGFQFAIFEYQEGLIPADDLQRILSEAIKQHRAQFETEFREIKAAAGKFWNDRRVWSHYEPKVGALEAAARMVKLKKVELTFDDFAMIKAYRMQGQAQALLAKTMLKSGYRNSDLDGFAYKTPVSGGGLKLEIVGFDFEYFEKIQPQEAALRLEVYDRVDRDFERRGGIGFTTWSGGPDVTRMQAAGYLALLEKENL